MNEFTNVGPIILTGGSSQIGLSVLRRLASASCDVVALRRKSNIPTVGNVSVREFDLTQPSKNQTLQGVGTALIHIAGITLLPANLDYFADCGVKRIVCFSSTSIDSKQSSPDPAERRFAEDLQKAESAVAEICDRRQMDFTILRPTMIYGLGLDKNISRAARFIRRFGVYPLAVQSGGLRQPVHADDLADAAIRILGMPGTQGRTYEVGGGEILSYCEMIGRVFDILEKPRRLIRIPLLASTVRAAEVLTCQTGLGAGMIKRMGEDLICDNSAAIREFDYRPRGFLSAGRSDIFPPAG